MVMMFIHCNVYTCCIQARENTTRAHSHVYTHTTWVGIGDAFIEHVLSTESNYRHTSHTEGRTV